jgi:hypothetical protein
VPSVNIGLVATDDPVANELLPDIRDKIANLDVDNTQFSTLLMKLSQERAKSFKVEWLNDELLPMVASMSASAVSEATNLAVTSGDGSYFKDGDVFRVSGTGETVRVNGAPAAASITVVRDIDGVGAISIASTDKLIKVGGSNPQGGTLPTAVITERAHNYNYTQIFRDSYRFTNTVRATSTWAAGSQEAIEKRKKAIEHKWGIENMCFFGARSYTASSGAVSQPRHTSGGLKQFVTASSDTDTLTEDELQTFFRNALEYAGPRVVLFCAPLVMQVISSFLDEDYQSKEGDNIHGVKVDYVLSGVTGQKVPVIVKKEWKRYGESAAMYGSQAVLVDLDNVQLAPLRDTVHLSDRQARDADEVAGEYLSEISLKVERPEHFRWLVDVTGAA